MRILTTISYYRPHLSGLTICVERLINALVKKDRLNSLVEKNRLIKPAGKDWLGKEDFEFTVLTSRNRNNLPKYEKSKKVKVIRIPTAAIVGKVPLMPGYLFSIISELKTTDLVWIHLPQAEGLLTALTARFMKKPIVVTVHCLPLLPSGWQRKLFQRMFDLINNLTIKLANRVVYYTKDYAENTRELWHYPEKSEYIFPPVEEGRRKKEKGRRKKELTVGFAGRIAEDKGLEYLVRAIKLMKDKGKEVNLLIAGSRKPIGEAGYANKIDNLIKESGIPVKYLGEINPDAMGRFYRLIDVLVLPSVNRTEAFGMVQVEAMMCGISVVASDLPGVRVPVKLTGFGQIVPFGDSQVLVEAILELLLISKIKKDKIIDKARKIFSIKETIDAYTRLLLEV